MSLSFEPSQPSEREQRHLSPKSYADAVSDATPLPNGEALHGPSYNSEEHLSANGYRTERKQDAHENTPNKETKHPSDASSRAFNKQKLEYPESGRLQINGVNRYRQIKRGSEVIIEKYVDAQGEHLMSIKPEEDDEKDKVLRSELVSGRKAGAGWEKSGIRWAPLNVPLKRRLQTLMVLMHTLSIAMYLTTFFFLCSIPLLWPLLIPYLIYCLLSSAGTSGELSFRSERLRRLPVWSLFASYFPARLHRTQELPPTRKYIFGYHPHGIISHGAFVAFATEALGFSQLFPGITNTLLTLDSNFRIPLYRDHVLRMGLASVSYESCENLLSKGGPNGEGMGRAITIVVGGARESLEAQPGSFRLILNRRKGFVKMAIRNGADLVPVLAFGENDLYEQIVPENHPWVHKMQLLVKKVWGFTVPLFHARGIFNYDVGLMPYRRPINIVVGKPILVQQMKDPSEKVVHEVQQRYEQELLRVWNEWKDVFAKDRKGELEIIE